MTPWVLAVVLPVSLWLLFVAWRSLLLPVGNSDALSYHLPRAVRFLVDGGYRSAPEINNRRLVTFPANYELLLASVLATNGSDNGTVLYALVPYVGFALVAASLARRWWGGVYGPLATFACTAATPLALLHAGAHKNDLLFAFFAAFAVRYLVTWALGGAILDAIFGISGLALTIGTKPHGCLLGVFAAPLLIAGGLKALRSSREGARLGCWPCTAPSLRSRLEAGKFS